MRSGCGRHAIFRGSTQTIITIHVLTSPKYLSADPSMPATDGVFGRDVNSYERVLYAFSSGVVTTIPLENTRGI